MKNAHFDRQEMLTKKLADASRAYYNGDQPLMSDIEFDKEVEELRQIETKTGIVLAGSPTVNVGAVVVNGLEKVKHEVPALSLSKFKYKDRQDLVSWMKQMPEDLQVFALMWKLDGLTCVLTYDDGELVQAATRGDGVEGSDITHNARFFEGVPQKIPYTGHLIVRGEAVMMNDEFNRVNNEEGGIYENARNLASATIQSLDSEVCRKRKISFIAFEVAYPAPEIRARFNEKHTDRLWELEKMGFNPCRFRLTSPEHVLNHIEEWKKDVSSNPFPTDGLVITVNRLDYGWTLGSTGHHPRWSVALKWEDEAKRTTLRDVEWSVGKTGVVTPVAIFDSVRLGIGSNVTRASLHNISCLRNVPLANGKQSESYMALGDEVEVYLANMIIPQISCYHNGDHRKSIEIPHTCPVCGQPLRQKRSGSVVSLHCDNDNCSARKIGNLVHAFGKEGLNVKGLGESQICDLMDARLVNGETASFYTLLDGAVAFEPDLDRYRLFDERKRNLLKKDGWGEKKWQNLMDALSDSRNTTFQRFLISLNVPLLGHDLSKKIIAFFDGDPAKFTDWVHGTDEKLATIVRNELPLVDGVGAVKYTSLDDWASNLRSGDDVKWFDLLYNYLSIEAPAATAKSDQTLVGKTFVITGDVHSFKNRDEFKAYVEAKGGKVAGSVSKKTDFLVINDLSSTTSKAVKARDLGIPLISEDEFLNMFGE